MPAGRHLLTRRTTLALPTVVVALTAGCDAENEDSAPPGSGVPSEADLDGALVDEVLADLAAITGLVAAVGDRFPRLVVPMSGLRAMHEAHTEALEGTASTDPGSAGLPATPAAALGDVRRREQRLRSRLVQSAVAARSGALARLLASMSAAVNQRLATLPRDVA